MKNNVINCINENWISSKGRFIKKFEDNFKKNLNIKCYCYNEWHDGFTFSGNVIGAWAMRLLCPI